MARICEDWFPKGSRPNQKKDGFYMDDNLKRQIEIMAKNITHDWDFTIIITGGGEVRVGKSLLEMQIMAYWSWLIEKLHGIKVPFSIKENIVFNWHKLIDQGHKLAQKTKYCALGYDEAGETMEGTKTQSKELRAVRDYLRECGQYNFLNILVMPEFFDLPKGIAITRSIFLIDVYYITDQTGIFKRGFFKFYSRKNKKQLYIKGKKDLNYNAHVYNFDGRFYNFYPVDEKEYREEKIEALKNRATGNVDKVHEIRNGLLYILNKKVGWTQQQISNEIKRLTYFELPQQTICDAISSFIDKD